MKSKRLKMPERVIAMDPGGRSGWASARMGPDRFEFTGSGVLRQDLMARQFAKWQGVYWTTNPKAFHSEQEYWPHDVLVYETWYPRRQNGSMDWIEGDRLLSAQHVGQIRLIADLSGMKIVDQHPSDKPQAVATMPKVFAELDRDSNEQHDQDARMHLWLYFWREWFSGTVDPESTVIV